MQNVDERGQAIRDQFAMHPVRRWIGTHLVGFGESLLDNGGDQTASSAMDRPPT